MDTTEKIIEATFKVLLEKGLNNTAITDISKESQLSPGTIYYYFDDKDEIILATLNKYVVESYSRILKNSKEIDGTAYEKIHNHFKESTLKLGKDYIPYQNELDIDENFKKIIIISFEAIRKYEKLNEQYNEYNKSYTDFLNEIIEEGKESGEIRDDLSTFEIVNLFKSTLNGIFFLTIIEDGFDIENILESNFKNIWDYIKN